MPSLTAGLSGLNALRKLKDKMLGTLTPIEGAKGSLFKPTFEGAPPPKGSPTLSNFRENKNAVYPVYHGSRTLVDEPLRPLSKSHNDVTTLVGQRVDPRALAYGTTDPEIARLHAYGVDDIAKSPNLRAYVGRDLPQVYPSDFSTYDIGSLFKNLSRSDKEQLFELYGVNKYGLAPRSDRSLEYLLRSDPERLVGQGVNDISDELMGLKAARLEQMPKNYIQKMNDLSGFKPSGAARYKEMYQMMLTDPDEALRLEQLIPLKGEYAKGGLVQVKECACHGR
jgi:hypothetical protein